ncbi:hypothetical protein GIS00_15770 [Nakamurella sp. YIM 132087]|uniref:Uncharacterized protein n=1 Tax=Nakamurella alba TaxID=2665158 RepID=A0A7K1FMN8_9ACTN|nr:hypothetical protein [Nakamurella alba]MTD15396.1 hypothetical protein [Nakamurella alba]
MARRRVTRRTDRLVAAVVWWLIAFLVVLGIGIVLNGAVIGWLVGAVVVGLLFAWWMDARWRRDHPIDP